VAVLLDTHVWVWWLSGSDRLAHGESQALDTLASQGELRLAAISLWEVQMAYKKGRFVPADGFERWLQVAAAPETIQLIPLDVPVALALNDLPERLHNDPADRLIVATAKAYRLQLATHAETLRKLRVASIWKP
jgi:PIN domain nuclease of toxin-antitoxin system